MRQLYYVDLAMCGGENLPVDFDLEEFCEVLQGKVPEFEIVAVTEPEEPAINRAPTLISDAIFNEALGEYCAR